MHPLGCQFQGQPLPHLPYTGMGSNRVAAMFFLYLAALAYT